MEVDRLIRDMTSEERGEFFARMPPRQKREWDLRQAWNNALKPGHNSGLAERARDRMARVDAMPPEIRAMVYEFGLEVVQPFLDHRVNHAPNIAFLISTVLRAERPHSIAVKKLFTSRGVKSTSIDYLIDTVLGSDFENGQPRFKINKSPSAKQNPLNKDDDDEAYFVVGPAITSPVRP